MHAEVAKFRNYVRSGLERQKIAGPHSQPLRFSFYDIDEPRPRLLHQPELQGHRLWVAQAVGLLIGQRPGTMSIVSTGRSDAYLERYYQFGEFPDGAPRITLHSALADDTAMAKANAWVRIPEKRTEIIDGPDAFKPEAITRIEQALAATAIQPHFELPHHHPHTA